MSPGPVATDLWLGGGGVAETVAGITGASPQDIVDAAAHSSATGRFTRPDEIADLVLFLASGARRQHHRSRLHHRRRTRADLVTQSSPGNTRGPAELPAQTSVMVTDCTMICSSGGTPLAA